MKALATVLFACSILSCAAVSLATEGEPQAVRLPVVVVPEARLSLSGLSGRPGTILSLAELEALGMYRVQTATFWPADDGVYEGPLLRDVLRAASLDGVKAIRVTGLDGFSQRVPREDWQRWPLMLATRRDGEPMSRRSKGPFRIIYPRDMHADLKDPSYRLRWVWLIERIEAVSE